jgi:DNA-binding response OmpR family regulator
MAVKILVVDADPTVQRALSNALAQVGFEVIVSSEGTDALRLARSERPALVLVASNLAGIDGFTVVSRLRMEDGPSTHTPAILLLTENQADSRSKALRSGADDYLIKPFHPAELMAASRRSRIRWLPRSADRLGSSCSTAPRAVSAPPRSP